MFLCDFSKSISSRKNFDFSEYCRLEGLDRLSLLSRYMAEKGMELKKGNAAAPLGLKKNSYVLLK